MCAAVYRQRHLVKATETTAGLAESNGSLPGLWRDSLHVTCGLTACTPGPAPGPTLGNEYGKTLPLNFLVNRLPRIYNDKLKSPSLGFLRLTVVYVVGVYRNVRQGDCVVRGHAARHRSGARFTKYLTIILRVISYNNAEVTIDLRRSSNLQNTLRRAQGFSCVQFTCKSSETVFANQLKIGLLLKEILALFKSLS